MIGEVMYYECHVTVEPVFGERLEELKSLADSCSFRVANLVMLDKDFPNQKDSFCSARHKDLQTLGDLMLRFVGALKIKEYKVFRYKLEATLFDTKEIQRRAEKQKSEQAG
jgi:hypothetical protein